MQLGEPRRQTGRGRRRGQPQLARARGDGFISGFLWALFLTPLVGFAVTMLRLPSQPKARENGPI